MSIKNVFYDLDGTLLPMDLDVFIKSYFKPLAAKFVAAGYDADRILAELQEGIMTMIANDGSQTNEELFMSVFKKKYTEEEFDALETLIMDFYTNDFISTKEACGFNEKVPECIELVKSLGLKQYITTNPLFPAVATRQRVEWAGLDINDFETVTTYENTCFCKPNPLYYQEIIDKFGLKAEECLMVGNNTDEDMIAATLGVKVFLVTDDLINESGQDINKYPHGNFDDLMEFIRGL